MADISLISRLINGVQRNVDISANTLVTTSIKVGGPTVNTELTKAILDNLVSLQDGSEVAGTLHTHNDIYFTETELGSSAASSGSDLIGDDNTYSNFTPAAATVKGALSGIDSALATAGATEFSDAVFRIQDNADATKEIAFEAAAITTGTLRTITMPDANVDLGEVNTSIQQDGSRAFTADQSMGGFKLTNLGTPTADADAVTKAYVDAFTQGLDVKGSVRAATTANIADLSTGAPDTVDGVSLALNDRVLVKDQSTGSENGIYVVDTVGTGANGSWSRATDADEDAEVTAGLFTFVAEGSTYADSGWVLTTNDPITVGTTALVFAQFSGAGQVTAGAGLTKTGNQLDVGDIDRGIQVNADDLEFSAAEAAGSGLEADTNTWQLRIASSAAGAGLTGGSGAALAVGAGDGITVNATDVEVNTSAIAGTGLEDDGANNLRIASAAYDQDTITGGAGSAAAVQHAPQLLNAEVAGEEFLAGLYAVRYGVTDLDTPETGGRVYKADPTELSLVKTGGNKDPFHVIGLAQPGSTVSAGGALDVVKSGLITATAHGFAIGEPIWLDSSGALTSTAPSTSGEAAVKVGVAKDANTIDIHIQITGVA